MGADAGEIRMRQRPLVRVELAALGAACVALPAALVGPGWRAAATVFAICLVSGLVLRERAFVADAEGVRVPAVFVPWRRSHLRWSQILGVRLVPSSFERPGRRIEFATSHGWVELGAPRDGWLVRDARLEGLVEQLWRRVPPAASPLQPPQVVEAFGFQLVARCAAIVVLGLVITGETARLLPVVLGVAVAFVYWVTSPSLEFDDRVISASSVLRRRRSEARWSEVRDVDVVRNRLGRRRIEVVGAGRRSLPVPRDGLLLRDPRIDRIAADLRSRIPPT